MCVHLYIFRYLYVCLYLVMMNNVDQKYRVKNVDLLLSNDTDMSY